MKLKQAVAIACLTLDARIRDETDGLVLYELRQSRKVLSNLTTDNLISRSEKHSRILKMLQEQPDLSFREIGRRCGAHHLTVCNLAKKLDKKCGTEN